MDAPEELFTTPPIRRSTAPCAPTQHPRLRDEVLQKCSGVKGAIRREKETTELLMARLTLHLTSLRRQAKLQASLGGERSLVAKVREDYDRADMVVGLLRNTLDCATLNAAQRKKAEGDIAAALQNNLKPIPNPPRPLRKRQHSARNRVSEPLTHTLDLPCDKGHRRFRASQPHSAPKPLRSGRRPFPSSTERSVTAPPANLCIRTGYADLSSMDGVIGKEAPIPAKPDHHIGKRVSLAKGKIVHAHKSEVLPESVFDNTSKAYALRSAVGSITQRTGWGRFVPHPPPPMTVHTGPLAAVPLSVYPETVRPWVTKHNGSLMHTTAQPQAPLRTDPAMVERRRCQALSGSHNIFNTAVAV